MVAVIMIVTVIVNRAIIIIITVAGERNAVAWL